MASPQLRMGIVHLFEIFFKAKYNCFNAASSDGKTRLLLITFRKLIFTDYRVDAVVTHCTPHTTQRAVFPHWAVQLYISAQHFTA